MGNRVGERFGFLSENPIYEDMAMTSKHNPIIGDVVFCQGIPKEG